MSSVIPLQEKMSEVAVVNGDALRSMVEVALSASEQLLALNLSMVRSLAARAAELPEGSMLEQMTAQFNVPVRGFEVASDYLRDASTICFRSQAEVARIDARRVGDVTRVVKSLLEGVAKSGPKGSQEVVEQIESAMSSASEAYENMLMTTSEMAENNLAVAHSAMQPTKAATQVTPKATRKAA